MARALHNFETVPLEALWTASAKRSDDDGFFFPVQPIIEDTDNEAGAAPDQCWSGQDSVRAALRNRRTQARPVRLWREEDVTF